ncbi:MAG: hypothetical protein HOV94_38515 [Saccharothrix sp.]|nr:hypothetical protein [Saccharothrix sp.]
MLGSGGAYVSHGPDPQEDALAAGKPFDDLSTSGRLRVVTSRRSSVDPVSAVRVLEVIEAAFTSARTGQVVSW